MGLEGHTRNDKPQTFTNWESGNDEEIAQVPWRLEKAAQHADQSLKAIPAHDCLPGAQLKCLELIVTTHTNPDPKVLSP